MTTGRSSTTGYTAVVHVPWTPDGRRTRGGRARRQRTAAGDVGGRVLWVVDGGRARLDELRRVGVTRHTAPAGVVHNADDSADDGLAAVAAAATDRPRLEPNANRASVHRVCAFLRKRSITPRLTRTVREKTVSRQNCSFTIIRFFGRFHTTWSSDHQLLMHTII